MITPDPFAKQSNPKHAARMPNRVSAPIAFTLVFLSFIDSPPAVTEEAGANSQAPRNPKQDGNNPEKVLQFEGLKVDVTRGRIEAPGNICLNQGLIEYLACAPGGKEHESLLRLECKPQDLYVALQTLGLKPGKGVEYQGEQKAPTGDMVYLVVEWQQENKTLRYRAEDLIWNVYDKTIMKRTGWVFVGSQFVEDPVTGERHFRASLERNIAATYHDPSAILDHPLSTGADDTTYEANGRLLPEVGTPVKLLVLKEEPKD